MAIASLSGVPRSTKADGLPAHVGSSMTNSIGMTLTYLPAGDFLMGGDLPLQQVLDRYSPGATEFQLKVARIVVSNEYPQHRVKISTAFLMGTNNVTRGQFAAFVKDTGYVTEAEKAGWALGVKAGRPEERLEGISWRKPGFDQADDHPVVCVSWNDAVAFCAWLSKKEGRRYRLPTEAEREYACRAGGKTAFPWGDEFKNGKGWANLMDQAGQRVFPQWKQVAPWDDGYVFTSPVATFKPNAWGLYDMVGNVCQWCGDFEGPYAEGAVTDPVGPKRGAMRVARGCGWETPTALLSRVTTRRMYLPFERCNHLGFRVVMAGE
jgi:formylglycine-generating enzyme required for sulfatase activity